MSFNRHEFWKNPKNSNQSVEVIKMCEPKWYIDLNGITNLIVSELEKYLDFEDSIYEIGCGTGRNLAGLYDAGFKNVSGVEINIDAINLGKESFPSLKNIEISCGTVEKFIKEIPAYDCIFTQGILQHLPPETDWVHKEIIEKSKKIIMVIENEKPTGVRSWARNYYNVFTNLGLKQLESKTKTGLRGHSDDTVLRVFSIK